MLLDPRLIDLDDLAHRLLVTHRLLLYSKREAANPESAKDIAQGGNTNNSAPSDYFSNTSEYALPAAVLEINLVALNTVPNNIR